MPTNTNAAQTTWTGADSENVGEITMWPTASPPAGWLICDGSAVSRSTYAALWALIGTTFGSGDGSTTFNIPNFQDRSPQGASATDAIGAQVGVKMQTSVPQHRHEMKGHDAVTGGNYITFATQNNLTGRYTQYTGVAGGVDQRGPRLAIAFIIKY